MKFAFYKTFEKDSLADGASYEDVWIPDRDLVLKRIHIKNKDGSALTKSTFYFKVAETVYTHALVPAAILGPDIMVSPVLDIGIIKGQRFDFTFKNQEGKTISVFISLESWEA